MILILKIIMDDGGQGYRLPVIRQTSPGDVMGGVAVAQSCPVCLKVAQRADLESSHHRKENV